MSDHEWVVTHGDMAGTNLLVDPSTQTLRGVIDWEHAQIADPARDFFELVDYGWDFVDQLIDEYTALGGSLGTSGRYRIRKRAQLVMFFGIRRAHQRQDDYWMQRDIEQLRERLTAPEWT